MSLYCEINFQKIVTTYSFPIIIDCYSSQNISAEVVKLPKMYTVFHPPSSRTVI